MITVFTPTYNRAHLLLRLYESLKEQTSMDFEWLIVDDGSQDNTTDVLKNIIDKGETDFSIRYFRVENGGKHRAINYGVQKANGEAFFIVDSDDWLTKDSIKDINFYFNQIKNDNTFAGVAGLKASINDNSKQLTFEGEFLDATSLERKRYGIFGEKAEVFKTDILKKYPFPEYLDEKFISEAIVWHKIAQDGLKLRWFNKTVYIFEYQEDGLSKNLYKKYQDSPIGYLTYVKQEMEFNHETKIKKFLFYGKCLKIIKKSRLSKKKAREILGINLIESIISKIIWNLYTFIK